MRYLIFALFVAIFTIGPALANIVPLASTVPGYSTLCIQNANKTRTIEVCPSPSPTPSSSPTPSPTPTASPTPSPTPTASPTPEPTPTVSPTPSATPPPYGSIVWQLGDPNLGKWEVGNTYQCGTPVQTGTTFYFDLKQNGTNCGRNQFVPLDSSGATFRLTSGRVYTWVFEYIDGNANDQPPGMGNDNGEAQSIVFQMHGYNESDTPLTQLGFGNTPPSSGSGQPQEWLFDPCGSSLSAPSWTGPYAAGETDQFVVQVLVADDNTGWAKLWRNGQFVLSCTGPNFHNSTGDPWWNAGIYKWRWELSGGGGSDMTEVQDTLVGLTLYEQ